MKQIQQGRPCSPLSDLEMPLVLRMKSEGMTQLEIGQKYGITQSAVSQAIKRYSESLPSTVVDTEPKVRKKKT
jgi:DNA-directed RNA polymerase specialized sigma subunit